MLFASKVGYYFYKELSYVENEVYEEPSMMYDVIISLQCVIPIKLQ